MRADAKPPVLLDANALNPPLEVAPAPNAETGDADDGAAPVNVAALFANAPNPPVDVVAVDGFEPKLLCPKVG